MDKSEKYKITKEELSSFNDFIKKHKIKHNFRKVYRESVYFGSDASHYLGWNIDTIDKAEMILLCKLLSALFDIELIYSGR